MATPNTPRNRPIVPTVNPSVRTAPVAHPVRPVITNTEPKGRRLTGYSEATTVRRAPSPLLFTKDNYTWLIAGLVIILIGFFLMSGGKSADPHKFNYNDVYSFSALHWHLLFY